MTFKIFKRNGSVEPFSPTKANGWGEFCAEQYKGRVDWGAAVGAAMNEFRDAVGVQSSDWHLTVIKKLLEQYTWPAQVTAGKMYIFHLVKEMYQGVRPTLRRLHTELQELKLMRHLDYSDAEYAELEKVIDHDFDQQLAWFQIEQHLHKYAIKNAKTKAVYETPQYILMRMAMALSEDDPKHVRMTHVKNFYELFKIGAVSSPSPNYEFLGTPHHGVLSCCLYEAGDSAGSLSAADHITYQMTLQSAGLGVLVDTRTANDPIGGGAKLHKGKAPYFRSIAASAAANVQGSRGGAVTGYVSMFDPEAMFFIMAQNPKTDPNSQIRNMHFAMIRNNFLVKQANNDGMVPVFTSWNAQKAWDAMFSKDPKEFERVATEMMANGWPVTRARDLLLAEERQSREVSTLYYFNATAANVHTAFLEPIRSSNLCMEIMQPKQPYSSVLDLYTEEDHGRGEISMCGIGSLNQDVIGDDEALAKKAAYYSLRMIYKCIQMTDYAFPHVRMTSQARRNAAVGMVGVAAYLARRNAKYDAPEGLGLLHRLGERHWYYLLSASCDLAEEFGPAPWIHKTKFPQGYSVLDTYFKPADEGIPAEYLELRYDHEELRKRTIACGGGAFSTLVSHMPNESSSKVLPGSPNSYYPVREHAMLKEDKTKSIYWTAIDNDILQYQSAFDIEREAQIDYTAVIQKWSDGGMSADMFDNRVKEPMISEDRILQLAVRASRKGVKSRYYTTPLTVEVEDSGEVIAKMLEKQITCAGGCS